MFYKKHNIKELKNLLHSLEQVDFNLLAGFKGEHFIISKGIQATHLNMVDKHDNDFSLSASLKYGLLGTTTIIGEVDLSENSISDIYIFFLPLVLPYKSSPEEDEVYAKIYQLFSQHLTNK